MDQETPHFKHGTMGKVQIVNNSKCDNFVPFSERYRNYIVQLCTQQYANIRYIRDAEKWPGTDILECNTINHFYDTLRLLVLIKCMQH